MTTPLPHRSSFTIVIVKSLMAKENSLIQELKKCYANYEERVHDYQERGDPIDPHQLWFDSVGGFKKEEIQREEQARIREEVYMKTQEEMRQQYLRSQEETRRQLESLTQMFQSQNQCNPNPWNYHHNPNDDYSGGGGIGGAGVGFEVGVELELISCWFGKLVN
ncbi:hypothetical protein RND81_13G107100 [Saponaria officinalis]|uniref:Uncharacterized protein n=2 Tax=Saponaria officinalis TaxID=3572 RepID=A0AAW1H1R7_SAPOF